LCDARRHLSTGELRYGVALNEGDLMSVDVFWKRVPATAIADA